MTEKPKLLIASIEDSAEGQAKLATLAAGGYRPIVGGLVYHPPLGDFPFITAIFAHHEVDEARTEAYEAENNLAEGQMANYEARIAALEAQVSPARPDGCKPAYKIALAEQVDYLSVMAETLHRYVHDAIESRLNAVQRRTEALSYYLDPKQTYLPPDTPPVPVFTVNPDDLSVTAEEYVLPREEYDAAVRTLLLAERELAMAEGECLDWYDGNRLHRHLRDALNALGVQLQPEPRLAEEEAKRSPAQVTMDDLIAQMLRDGAPDSHLDLAYQISRAIFAQAHPARKVEDAEPQPAAEPTITLPRTALDDWYMRFALASVTGVMDGSTRKGFNDLLIEIAALIEEHGS